MKTRIFYDFEATSVSRDADMISFGATAVTEKLNLTWKEYRKLYLLTHVDKQHFIPEYTDNRVDIEVKTFYAEFTDFNIDKCDDWVKENVVSKLTNGNIIGSYVGNTGFISHNLKKWLSQFEEIEFWADFDVIDKPMLIDLIADWDIKKDYTLHNKVYQECKGIIETIAYHNSDKTLVEDFVSFYPPKTEFIKYNKVGLPEHLPNIKYDQFFDLHTLFKIKGIDTDISRKEFVISTPEEWLEYADKCSQLGFTKNSKHNALYDSYVNWLCYQKLMVI